MEEEAVGARKRKGHGEAGADAANNKPRSLNPHEREASRWASICSHQRRRSRCKECGGSNEEADNSMPAGLEELEEAGV